MEIVQSARNPWTLSTESMDIVQTDVLTNGIYEAMFSYFGYLCNYFPLRGLDTQQKNIATKISNLRNKSHLDTKMNTSVSNCPNL